MTIFQRQLATLFFMVIFMAVQVMKVSHTHDVVMTKTGTASKAIFGKTTFACTICDYDFAKNKDNFYAQISLQKKTIPLVHQVQHIHTRLTSIGASTTDRGPPSLI